MTLFEVKLIRSSEGEKSCLNDIVRSERREQRLFNSYAAKVRSAAYLWACAASRRELEGMYAEISAVSSEQTVTCLYFMKASTLVGDSALQANCVSNTVKAVTWSTSLSLWEAKRTISLKRAVSS
jgi:hypothetical protein